MADGLIERAEGMKLRGNTLFKTRSWAAARDCYSQCLGALDQAEVRARSTRQPLEIDRWSLGFGRVWAEGCYLDDAVDDVRRAPAGRLGRSAGRRRRTIGANRRIVPEVC